MKTLTHPVDISRILTVNAHPDDREMHHAGIIAVAGEAHSYTATRGEASSINRARESLCRLVGHTLSRDRSCW